MYLRICLVLCSVLFRIADLASTYDQSQNGDLNVQVDLKDLHIIALMKGGKEEYVDYDYAYDYSEMTIKPQHGATQKPLNASDTSVVMDNSTLSLPVTVTYESTTEVLNSTAFENIENVNSSSTATATLAPEKINTSTATTSTILGVTTPGNPEMDKNITAAFNSPDCKKGFVLNQKGDCELKMPSAGNALLKLVKLSQKLKLRRENRQEDKPQ